MNADIIIYDRVHDEDGLKCGVMLKRPRANKDTNLIVINIDIDNCNDPLRIIFPRSASDKALLAALKLAYYSIENGEIFVGIYIEECDMCLSIIKPPSANKDELLVALFQTHYLIEHEYILMES